LKRIKKKKKEKKENLACSTIKVSVAHPLPSVVKFPFFHKEEKEKRKRKVR